MSGTLTDYRTERYERLESIVSEKHDSRKTRYDPQTRQRVSEDPWPFLLLDAIGQIRYCHKDAPKLLGYDSCEEIKSHRFIDFLSFEPYSRSLRKIAYLIQQSDDKLSAGEHINGSIQGLERQYLEASKLDPRKQQARFDSLIQKFTSQKVDPENENHWCERYVPLVFETETKKGDSIEWGGHITLYADHVHGNRHFLGMQVSVHKEKKSWLDSLKFWRYWASPKVLPAYELSDEYVYALPDLGDKEAVGQMVTDLNRRFEPTSAPDEDLPPVVLDFDDVGSVTTESFNDIRPEFEIVFNIMKKYAQAEKMIFGNANQDVRDATETLMKREYGKKRATPQFHQLVYPLPSDIDEESPAYEVLERRIESGLESIKDQKIVKSA